MPSWSACTVVLSLGETVELVIFEPFHSESQSLVRQAATVREAHRDQPLRTGSRRHTDPKMTTRSLCVPKTSVTLCDPRVFVDEAAEAVAPEGARRGVDGGRFGGADTVGASLAE